MRVTITLDGMFLRRAALAAITCGGLVVLSQAQASNVPSLNTFTAGTTVSSAAVNQNFEDLRQAANDNDARIVALEALLAGVTRVPGPIETIAFTGVNVQIRNAGAATDSADGSGNLILGHNENVRAAARTGSHTLVIGDEHEWTSYAGALVGSGHTVSGLYGVAVGGSDNTVTGVGAAQFGGRGNQIDDTVGGTENGQYTACVGGLNGSYSEDDGAAVGTGAAIADLGLDAAVTIVGDASGFVDVGFGSNNVGLGRQATGGVIIGEGANLVHVGQSANAVSVAVNATVGNFRAGKFGGRYAGGFDFDGNGVDEGFEFQIRVQNGSAGSLQSVDSAFLGGTVDPTTGAFTGHITKPGTVVPLTGTFNESGAGFVLSGTNPVTGNTTTVTLSRFWD